MAWTASEETGGRLEEALEELLPVEPHLEYANFRPVAERPNAAVALHRARWAKPGEGIAALVAREDGRPRGALRICERRFESAHFSLRMARLEPPVAGSAAEPRLRALELLYRSAAQRLRRDGYQHLAARASTRDREGAWAIQGIGARWVDTQVSWMCPLTGLPHDEALPGRLRIEQRDRVSLAALPEDAWKRLAEWGGRAFDRGPLVFDLTLPQDRAREVYCAWTARVMRGEWADAALLAFDGDEVVAFISMLALPDVSEHSRQRVFGRGLGATLPDYRGLFTAIQREMIATRPLDADWMENETQAATIGSINVYAKLGFRYLRSTGTFHLRLDGSAAS